MADRRAAVCISGHLRCAKAGIEAFKRRVVVPNAGYEFDYFVDTWDEGDWRAKIDGQIAMHSSPLASGVVDTVMQELRPKALRIEAPRSWDVSRFQCYVQQGYVKKNTQGEHIPAMFSKIASCDAMMHEHEASARFVYDVVMRWRTDIELTDDIVLDPLLEDLLEAATADVVFVPRFAQDGVGPWATDVFALSSSQNMALYSGLYHALEQRVRHCGKFRPEPLLGSHLSIMCLRVKQLDVGFKVLS